MGPKDSQRMRRWGIAAVVTLAFVAAACGPQPGTGGPDGTPPLLCADGPYDLGEAWMGWVSADGRIVVIVVPNAVGGTQLVRVDTRSGVRLPVFTETAMDDRGSVYLSDDGSKMLLEHYPGDLPGISQWLLIDVNTGVSTEVLEGESRKPVAVDSDLDTLILGTWPAGSYERVDIVTGAVLEPVVLVAPGWSVRSTSGDLSMSIQQRDLGGDLFDLRITDVASGEIVRELPRVRRDKFHWATFVDDSTVLVTNASPAADLPDGVTQDSAFTFDIATGVVTRRDPGVSGMETKAISPDGTRQLYQTFGPATVWVRHGAELRSLAPVAFLQSDREISVGLEFRDYNALLHCL